MKVFSVMQAFNVALNFAFIFYTFAHGNTKNK
jgi:hypothetical protein